MRVPIWVMKLTRTEREIYMGQSGWKYWIADHWPLIYIASVIVFITVVHL